MISFSPYHALLAGVTGTRNLNQYVIMFQTQTAIFSDFIVFYDGVFAGHRFMASQVLAYILCS